MLAIYLLVGMAYSFYLMLRTELDCESLDEVVGLVVLFAWITLAWPLLLLMAIAHGLQSVDEDEEE